MTIKEVEEAVKIDRANIRYYEKEGLLVTRRNPLNGYRDYSEENIQCLKKIIFLRNMDLSIDDIRKLQGGQISMESLMENQEQKLKQQSEKLKAAARLCTELQSKGDLTFDTLDLSAYGEFQIRGNREILADAIGELAAVKDILLPWMFVILSLLTAIITFPLLPDQIVVDWDGIYATKEVSRIFTFLFPLGMAIVAIQAKLIISNILYRNMPHYLLYVDQITGYFSICMAIFLFTYQVISIAYAAGARMDFDTVQLIEIALFILGFILFILIPKHRKSAH